MAPTANMMAAASRRPSGSVSSAKISWNCPSWDATAIATRNPANMPAPPSDGVGRVCTLRGPGIAIAPMRGATHRMTNVSRNVTPAAIPAIVRYPGTSTLAGSRRASPAASCEMRP
jgi:hypothetical protein